MILACILYFRLGKLSTSTCPVAKRLKQARTSAGLSQKQLGIAAGIDEFSASARMNQYETGKHVPDFLTLKRIGKILKCPVSFFYSEDDRLAKMIIWFSKLSKDKQIHTLDLYIKD